MKKFIIILVVVIILGCGGYFGYSAYQSAMDNVVDQTIDSVAGDDVSSSVSEEDKTRIKEIISDSVSASDYKTLLDYYSSGDYEALESWASYNLSQEQIEELMSIANNYN